MAFEFPLTGSAKELIEKIDHAITKRNGKFSGDENKGEIELSTPVGQVRVGYKIENQVIKVDILEKPMFIPEDMIKGEILKMI